MDRIKISQVISILILLFSVSCTELSPIKDTTQDGYCLKLNITKLTYDSTTRANYTEWSDGDCLYLVLNNGIQKTIGFATYNAVDDSWNFKIESELPSNSSSCEVYHFENFEEREGELNLSSNTCIYYDEKAQFSKVGNEIHLNATLSLPLTRLRIKGIQKTYVKLSGLDFPESFSIKTGELSFSRTPIEVRTQKENITDFIYGIFKGSERTFMIIDDGIAYKKEESKDILIPGKSGYFDMPEPDNHIGWEKLIVSSPVLSKIAITEVGYRKTNAKSSIVDYGNGSVLEYGFCYALATNPSIDNAKFSLEYQNDSFNASIVDLQPNTTYHIRAYAINEFGVGYSEETTVKTKAASTPALSSIKIEDITSNSVNVKCEIQDMGDDCLTACGYVYSKDNKYPTLSDNEYKCEDLSELSVTITGLDFDSKYYIRAYATNPQGTSYSDAVYFTTDKDPTVWDGKSVATSFDGGIGSKNDPIRIATAAQLKLLADNVNNGNTYKDIYFILVNDINLNNFEWTAIGKYQRYDYTTTKYEYVWFCGNFNGGGHTIKGLNININDPHTGVISNGLFGATYLGYIINLGVEGTINYSCSISSMGSYAYYTGSICGYAEFRGNIENCISYVNYNGLEKVGGGIAGYAPGKNINNCVNAGNGTLAGLSVNLEYKDSKCNHSFWIYDVSRNIGNEFNGVNKNNDGSNSYSYSPNNNQCLIYPNYTKDLVEELNNWVYMNDGDIHYHKWEYEFVNGIARPKLIPEN